MKRRKANSKKSARLSRRQRRLYLGILWALKERNKKFDCGAWSIWQGHNTASAAYHFASRWGGRKDVNITKLQTAVIKFGSAKTLYNFALNIPEANINRIQYEIIKRDDPFWIRKFAELPGTNREMLERIAMVAEIMEEMV